MKKILFLLLCVIALKSNAIMQMRNWTLLPNKVTMAWGSTPIVSAIPGAFSSAYAVANGAYDENNNLLFYVRNDRVLDANSVDQGPALSGQPTKEVVIVPIPGQCKKYYVISATAIPLVTMDLYITTVDCSSGSVVVGTPSNFANLTGNGCGFAASKIVSGSGSSAIRYLYAITASKLTRFTISSSGIGSALDMSTGGVSALTNSQCIPTEAELTQDGTKFAWGSAGSANDGKVYQVLTSSPYTLTTYLLPFSGTRDQKILGIEYDASNNLWVSASSGTSLNNGIYKITTTATPSYLQLAGTSAYNNTQLENSIYGYILAVNNSGTLGYIDVSANTLSTSTLSIPMTLISNSSTSTLPNTYSLPDQVDGENYGYFNGIPQGIAQFQINAVSPSTVCGSPQNAYNCIPIILSNLSIDATSYTLQVNSIDVSCNIISGGSYLTYSSGSISTLPTDLRAMPGTNGTWLATNTGKYKVTLTASNGCTSTTTFGYLQVNAAPSAAVSNFQINNPVTGVPCYSASSSSPCTLCTGSPTMNISSSSGTVTYYKKTTEQLVSGTWTVVSGPTTVATPSGVSGATGVYVSTSGYSYTTGAQYRVNVEVGNDCGSNSKICYFTAVSCKTDGSETTTGIDNSATTNTINSILLYPNPTSGNTSLEFTLSKGENISAFITDLQGRKVLDIVKNKNYAEGNAKIEISTGNLNAGVYIYHISIDNKTTTGKFVKTN